MQVISPVITQQMQHKSVRKFLSTPVDESALTHIVTAAQRASTSSNMQVWSVIAITDPGRKKRIAAALDGQQYIEHAPVFLVWVADLARNASLMREHGVEAETTNTLEVTLMGALDVGIAAQNALLAAESLGLGGVFVGGIRNAPDAIVAELNLPPHVFPIVGMSLGTPDPTEGTGIRPRLPITAVHHREQYDATVWRAAVADYEVEYEQYFAGQGHPGRSWTRQVLSRLGSLSGLHGRDKIRAALRRQGFGCE